MNPGFLAEICEVYYHSTGVLLSPQGGTGLAPGIALVDTGSIPVSISVRYEYVFRLILVLIRININKSVATPVHHQCAPLVALYTTSTQPVHRRARLGYNQSKEQMYSWLNPAPPRPSLPATRHAESYYYNESQAEIMDKRTSVITRHPKRVSID